MRCTGCAPDWADWGLYDDDGDVDESGYECVPLLPLEGPRRATELVSFGLALAYREEGELRLARAGDPFTSFRCRGDACSCRVYEGAWRCEEDGGTVVATRGPYVLHADGSLYFHATMDL